MSHHYGDGPPASEHDVRALHDLVGCLLVRVDALERRLVQLETAAGPQTNSRTMGDALDRILARNLLASLADQKPPPGGLPAGGVPWQYGRVEIAAETHNGASITVADIPGTPVPPKTTEDVHKALGEPKPEPIDETLLPGGRPDMKVVARDAAGNTKALLTDQQIKTLADKAILNALGGEDRLPEYRYTMPAVNDYPIMSAFRQKLEEPLYNVGPGDMFLMPRIETYRSLVERTWARVNNAPPPSAAPLEFPKDPNPGAWGGVRISNVGTNQTVMMTSGENDPKTPEPQPGGGAVVPIRNVAATPPWNENGSLCVIPGMPEEVVKRLKAHSIVSVGEFNARCGPHKEVREVAREFGLTGHEVRTAREAVQRLGASPTQ